MNKRNMERLLMLSTLVVLLVAAALRFYQASSNPPGFHYDEAVNFIVTREIAFQGAQPFPVFAAFNGREVLYYYVSALTMLGIGEHTFSMHLTSGFMNLTTLAATIGLGRLWFGGVRGWLLGVLAAAFMAVSFPQIFIARQAFRAVSLPLLQALCLWALFRGLHQRHVSMWLPAAGVLGGAALYTYMASRLFPLWVGLAMLVLLYFDRSQWRRRFAQLAVAGVFLFLTALPITRYYLENPTVFNDRLNQLSGTEDSISYADSIELHLRMFFVEGDPFIRYNEPLAPYFSIVGGLLMLIGLGSAGWYLLKPNTLPLQRSAYVLVLLAPLMVIPSVLAVDGLPPSHMRSIGMVPMIFFLPALGTESIFTIVRGLRASPPRQQQLATTGVALVFGVLAIWVWGRYESWSNTPELYYLNDGDMVAAGEWLESRVDAETLVYVTSQHYDHPSLQMHDIPGDNIIYLLGERLFLPPATRHAYFVETANVTVTDSLRPFLDTFSAPHIHVNDDGGLAFQAYEFTPTARTLTQNRSGASIGGVLRLVEATSNPAPAGTTLEVITAWEILQPPNYDDFTPLFQLETTTGDVLDRVEPFMQRTTRWRAGETLIEVVRFEVPPGTAPADDYVVRVAWVGRTSDEYVGRLDANGSFAGLWTDVATVEVLRGETPATRAELSIPVQREVAFTGIQLLGHSEIPTERLPGEVLPLDLYWQRTTEPNAVTDAVQLELINTAGERETLYQGAPVDGRYPFTVWQPGETIIDRYRQRVPTTLPAGTYTVVVTVASKSVTLGEFSVSDLSRNFTLPDTAQPLNVNFSDTVRLAGYQLSGTTSAPGQSLELTLYWQSIAPTELPLTVFVHLTDPDGMNQAQRDAQPRQNTYPVPLWIPGEVVTDTYTLPLPPDAPAGQYALRVGLYLQSTGQRLGIQGQEQDFWSLATISVE